MVFEVPEDFLENYKCDKCFKFLSVKPIKIYPNRHIKCGRCTESDDGGTYSLLQNFAELVLFKCINRFDGCRMMLTSNQVENHEKECLSKEHICPICVESTNLPTYQILQHFKQHHRASILQNYYFILDIEEALEFKKVLLYRIKDYLFFIHIKSIPDSISFQIVLLGEHLTTDIVLNFFIYSEYCDLKKSIHGDSENGRFFVFPKLIFENNLVSIFFELKEKQAIAENIIEINHQNKNNTEREDLLQRKLFLGAGIFNTDLKMGKIVPFCYVCSELFLGVTLESYTQNTQWCIEDEKFQYVCLDCVPYFQTGLNKTLVKYTPISVDMYNSIKYFCTWKCNSVFTKEELLLHETTCSLQPSQECPINCCEFKGTVSTIKYHLENVHETTLIFKSFVIDIENIYNDIYFYIKGYFIKTSYDYSHLFKANQFNIEFCKSKPTHLELLLFFIKGTSLFTDLNSDIFNSIINCKIVLKKK